MDEREQNVWRVLLKDRSLPPERVAYRADEDIEYVRWVMSRPSSPNWKEALSQLPNEGVKFDSGKPRMDLIPPELFTAVGDILGFGAEKYSARNWELGMDWGRPYAALLRHITAWWGGEDLDPESGKPHTWHAACCIAFLVAFEARGTGNDDRPKE